MAANPETTFFDHRGILAMITKNSLLSGLFLGLGWVCVSGNLVVAQLPISERCLAGAESCAYQKYPQYNQQLNFRTSPQIEQRRLNTIENQCGSINSSRCNNLRPQVQELQETPTMQQLREQQIRIIQTR
ncbi:hypothetical protein [Microcystis aeruginosa]|uniref:Uncharacterized protein n=1 Tax=Microcystis aeruginosa 11-30S32 TaxID=2358142 RepID=A0A510PKD9_MICAE|nr:hypothetical protein [Microcystis aeruginosa]GCA94060.1 unknown protein [Microcystis aeruginosa 11-30S32]